MWIGAFEIYCLLFITKLLKLTPKKLKPTRNYVFNVLLYVFEAIIKKIKLNHLWTIKC